MEIGIAGPMSLGLLNYDFSKIDSVPLGYSHPPISLLINSLLTRGHKVVAYTTSTGISEPVVLKGDKLTICIARRRDRHSARDLFKLERKDLLDLMKRYPSHIINAQWSYEFAWAALDSGIRTLVSLRDHAITVLKYQFDGYRFMRMLMNYVVLNRAKYLSSNSQYLFNLLSKRNKKKAHVIPNFYAEDLVNHFSMPREKSSMILSVSNGFGRLKNISTALRGFSIIRKDFPEMEYHLVGDDMEVNGAAYHYAVKNNLADGVQFIGPLAYPKLIEKMRQAKMFLHPSKEESFGMIVLEAMVLGTPVVAGYRSGNVPFLLDKGNAGLLCDVNSPEEIAKGVVRILFDNAYAQSLILNANNFAKVQFSEEVVVPRYTDYYQEIIDKC